MPNRATPSRRFAGALAGATALALSFVPLASPAGATVGDRGHDTPPPVRCANGGVRWDAPGSLAEKRAAYELSTPGRHTITLAGISFGPGKVSVSELLAFDSYAGRESAATAGEFAEQVRVEYYKNGVMQAASYATDDLEEGYTTAWWRGPLGTVELVEGADTVKIVHASQFDGIGGLNAVTPSGVCFSYVAYTPLFDVAVAHDCTTGTVTIVNSGTADGSVVITVNGAATTITIKKGQTVTHAFALTEDTDYRVTVTAGDKSLADNTFRVDCTPNPTTPTTTVPPTTAPPTTAPPATTAPTTTAAAPATTAAAPAAAGNNDAAVLGTSVRNSADDGAVLAYTGRRSVYQAIGGALLLFAGVRLVRSSRRRLGTN